MAKSKPANAITKTEAVAQALTALGADAKGPAILAHVKEQHGLTITPAHLSNIKSTLKAKRKKRGRPKAAVAAVAAAVPAPIAASTAVAHASSSNGKAGVTAVSLDDLERVKELAKRYGAATLARLVGVVA